MHALLASTSPVPSPFPPSTPFRPSLSLHSLMKRDDEAVERVEQILPVRIRPRHVGRGRDARLRELADVPVLLVRHVPELHAVRRGRNTARRARPLRIALHRTTASRITGRAPL